MTAPALVFAPRESQGSPSAPSPLPAFSAGCGPLLIALQVPPASSARSVRLPAALPQRRLGRCEGRKREAPLVKRCVDGSYPHGRPPYIRFRPGRRRLPPQSLAERSYSNVILLRRARNPCGTEFQTNFTAVSPRLAAGTLRIPPPSAGSSGFASSRPAPTSRPRTSRLRAGWGRSPPSRRRTRRRSGPAGSRPTSRCG